METKTLAELAAGYNLYKVEDIPAQYKTDSFEHRIKVGNTAYNLKEL